MIFRFSQNNHLLYCNYIIGNGIGVVCNNPPLSKNERINRVTTALSISRIFGSIFFAISREGNFISKTAIFLLIFISKPST